MKVTFGPLVSIIVLFWGLSPFTTTAESFIPVCERSTQVRRMLERTLSKHCSQIVSEDLKDFDVLSLSPESTELKAGDFQGVHAKQFNLSLWHPIKIQPYALKFDSVDRVQIRVQTGYNELPGNKPFQLLTGALSGLRANQLQVHLKAFNSMDIYEGAFRDVEVEEFLLHFGAESISRFGGAIFDGMSAKKLTIYSIPEFTGIHILPAVQLSIPPVYFSGARIKNVHLEIEVLRVDRTAFKDSQINLVFMQSTSLTEMQKKQLQQDYPDILFSF